MALRMPTLAHTMQMTHPKSHGDSRDDMDVSKRFKIWAFLQSSGHCQLKFGELKIIQENQKS